MISLVRCAREIAVPLIGPVRAGVFVLWVCHGALAIADHLPPVRAAVAFGGGGAACILLLLQGWAALVSRTTITVTHGPCVLRGGARKIEIARTLSLGSLTVPREISSAPSLTFFRIAMAVGISGLILPRLAGLPQSVISLLIVGGYSGAFFASWAHRRVYDIQNGVLRVSEHDGTSVSNVYEVTVAGAQVECDFDANLLRIASDGQAYQIDLVAVNDAYALVGRLIQERAL